MQTERRADARGEEIPMKPQSSRRSLEEEANIRLRRQKMVLRAELCSQAEARRALKKRGFDRDDLNKTDE